MQVVRHDHECVQLCMGEMRGNFVPAFLHNFTISAEHRFFVSNRCEQAIPPVGANSNEIGAGLGIILCLQANCAAVQDIHRAIIVTNCLPWVVGFGHSMLCPYYHYYAV